MRRILACALGLSISSFAAGAFASDWNPAPAPPASPEKPAVTLGRPVALQPGTASATAAITDAEIHQAAYQPAGGSASAPVIQVQNVDPMTGPVRPGAPPTNPNDPYNCGAVTQPAAGSSFWDKCKNWFSGIPGFTKDTFSSSDTHHLFESDHLFDSFISPVTNPFLFEDPRSLTELRPIFIYQQAPGKNYVYHGGDIEFLGLQGRLALTERWSIVMSKLGLIWDEPHGNPNYPDFHSHVGFAEINIGPKFTFLRCEGTGTLAAAGLNFIIPAGDRSVFQNTGSLTLEPYVSLGQSFGRNKYGTFHALGTLGYNGSVDNSRSDFFFTSLHLDLDYFNSKIFYPLLELNYFHYTTNGHKETLNFEGADLFTFGSSHVAGRNEVTIALGARYKISECIQFGLAVETPLTNHSQLEEYRITADMIFRY